MSKKKAFVVGVNVSNSLSPTIFNYWFNKYKIDAEYGYIQIKEESFDNDIKLILKEKDLIGLNITMPYKEKIIMLDHDDLFSDLLKNENNFTNFKKYFTQLVEFCNGNNIKLLRTIGVVFSDDEKRVTQYIG